MPNAQAWQTEYGWNVTTGGNIETAVAKFKWMGELCMFEGVSVFIYHKSSVLPGSYLFPGKCSHLKDSVAANNRAI